MAYERYWYFFLCFLSLVTIGFAGKTLYQLYLYARLDASSTTISIEWTVKEISDERYLLDGKYTFKDTQGTIQSGESTLLDPFYLNAWAAQKAIDETKSQPRKIWYSSSNPKNSSLQKNFPLKECLSLLLLCGVVAYFFGLKHYVMKQYERDRSPK